MISGYENMVVETSIWIYSLVAAVLLCFGLWATDFLDNRKRGKNSQYIPAPYSNFTETWLSPNYIFINKKGK